jgi:hypothetical protein
LKCIDAVAREEATCKGDERTGIQILRRALEAPAGPIENSAVDGGIGGLDTKRRLKRNIRSTFGSEGPTYASVRKSVQE